MKFLESGHRRLQGGGCLGVARASRIATPQLYAEWIGRGLGTQEDRRAVDERLFGAKREATKARRRHLAQQVICQQRRHERALYNEAGIALDLHGIAAVVVDAV